MSYDIRLKDPVTDETLDLPVKHVMTGGTYQADYDEQTRTFSAKPISEAWLNVTYNYGRYYYDATDGDSRFAHDEISAYYADGTTGPVKTEYGIRGIYGKTGVESIPMLEDMIERIKEKYKPAGEWLITSRDRTRYRDKSGKEVDFYYALHHRDECTSEDYTEDIREGPCDDYWEATAANAIRPLYQLIAMAKLRPDGVWDGD